MNWIEVQESWECMVPVLQSYWPELSGADLERVRGQRDQLAAALRDRYSLNQEEAEQAISTFEKDVRFPGAVK